MVRCERRQTGGVEALPLPEVEAPPVVIRRYRGEELPALLEAVSASLDRLRPWMPWASADPLEAALADFIVRSVAHFDQGEEFHYAIWDDATSKLVGGTGLHPRVGPGRIEVGYWVRMGWLRRGIASAVSRALTSVAFSIPEIEQVHIRCDEANAASAGVPRRLGFHLIQVVDDEVTAPAETGRTMDWAIRRGEWQQRR